MPVMFIACIHLKSQNDHWQKPNFIGQYQTVVWRYEPNPSCAQWFSSNLSNSVTMPRIMINIIMRHCWGTIWVYGPADFDFTSYDLLFVSIELNFLMALQRYRSATCRLQVPSSQLPISSRWSLYLSLALCLDHQSHLILTERRVQQCTWCLARFFELFRENLLRQSFVTATFCNTTWTNCV